MYVLRWITGHPITSLLLITLLYALINWSNLYHWFDDSEGGASHAAVTQQENEGSAETIVAASDAEAAVKNKQAPLALTESAGQEPMAAPDQQAATTIQQAPVSSEPVVSEVESGDPVVEASAANGNREDVGLFGRLFKRGSEKADAVADAPQTAASVAVEVQEAEASVEPEAAAVVKQEEDGEQPSVTTGEEKSDLFSRLFNRDSGSETSAEEVAAAPAVAEVATAPVVAEVATASVVAEVATAPAVAEVAAAPAVAEVAAAPAVAEVATAPVVAEVSEAQAPAQVVSEVVEETVIVGEKMSDSATNTASQLVDSGAASVATAAAATAALASDTINSMLPGQKSAEETKPEEKTSLFGFFKKEDAKDAAAEESTVDTTSAETSEIVVAEEATPEKKKSFFNLDFLKKEANQPAGVQMEQPEQPAVATEQPQTAAATSSPSQPTVDAGPGAVADAGPSEGQGAKINALAAARHAFWQQDFKAANAIYKSLIASDAQNADLMGEYGNMLVQSGNLPAAMDSYEKSAYLLIEQNRLQEVQPLVGFIGQFDRDRAARIVNSIRGK